MKAKLPLPRCRLLAIAIAATSASLASLTGCMYVSSSSNGGSFYARSITNCVATGDISDSVKSLQVDNQFGAVHIVAGSGEKPTWSWKLMVGAETDALAVQAAQAASCQATTTSNGLSLTVSLPNAFNNVRFQSDLEIRVPKGLSLRVHNRFGDIRILGPATGADVNGQNGAMELTDIGGWVRAQNSFGALTVKGASTAKLKNQNAQMDISDISGPLEAEDTFAGITVRDIGGPINLHNQNGRVEASHIKGAVFIKTSFAELRAEDIQGEADLHNQNGQVQLTRVNGDASISTSFGEARVEQIDGNLKVTDQNARVAVSHVTGTVQAKTSFSEMDIEGTGTEFNCHDQNGAIRLRATSPQLASVEAETSFASLEVTLPAGLKPAVQARTSFADVESDFPVLLKSRGQDPFADVEPGTPRVRLQNQNGAIRITSERVAER